jgi:hypothetical protein
MSDRIVDLKAELDANAHPITGAYDADAQTAAAQLNAENLTRIRDTMSGSELWANTVATEYAALTDAQKSQWLAFCAIESHNTEVGGLAQLFVVGIFGGASDTVAALAAARTENISRADEIGVGFVRAGDVLEARAMA